MPAQTTQQPDSDLDQGEFHAVGTRTIRGRAALDRAGVAALTGRSDKTVEYWYQHRAETGFPEAIEVDSDGRQWYPQTEVKTFWKQHQAAIQNRLPDVDRTGDPNELVTAPPSSQNSRPRRPQQPAQKPT